MIMLIISVLVYGFWRNSHYDINDPYDYDHYVVSGKQAWSNL